MTVLKRQNVMILNIFIARLKNDIMITEDVTVTTVRFT